MYYGVLHCSITSHFYVSLFKITVMTNISKEYGQWLAEIRKQIRRSQIKAAVKVNTELLKLYWNLGKEISEKQMDTAWGSRFFDAGL